MLPLSIIESVAFRRNAMRRSNSSEESNPSWNSSTRCSVLRKASIILSKLRRLSGSVFVRHIPTYGWFLQYSKSEKLFIPCKCIPSLYVIGRFIKHTPLWLKCILVAVVPSSSIAISKSQTAWNLTSVTYICVLSRYSERKKMPHLRKV